MNYQIKPESGSLFPNTKKANERHPDLTGKAMINGKLMEISAWQRKSQSGNEYLTLAFREKKDETQIP